ncbi:LEA type 2 family protein [Halococcoides cellulosivorans]|uniref:Late embryogenesis abundant protein LEA-2 subgroup domain-containing protein n=1 Tax=Halococcoides cellulosivorans TaxID=1679096 RepID=A0A2R4X0K2_9EURY|nr:LEA type 2 family protein [Halococcoides cellulosivorans]AWB27283.1 hypothetical protein HARCEL1_05990 [Halococcoides cellulosivorans]
MGGDGWPPTRRVVGVTFLLGVVTLLAVGGIVTVTMDQPQVREYEHAWGNVTENTTNVETRATIDNPNPIGVPPLVGVAYDIRLDETRVGEGRTGGIGIPSGTSNLTVETTLDHAKIVEWWVATDSHGQGSSLTIAPRLEFPGFTQSLPEQSRAFRTSLLPGDGLDDDTVRVGDDELRLTHQSVRWGDATDEETVVRFAMSMAADREIEIDHFEFAMRANDVTMGVDRVDGATATPGSERVVLKPSIDTQTVDDWWASHVSNDETSTVEFVLVAVVTVDGHQHSIVLDSFSKHLVVETDLLGPDATAVTSETLDSETALDAVESA